jgi:hypothetical protein
MPNNSGSIFRCTLLFITNLSKSRNFSTKAASHISLCNVVQSGARYYSCTHHVCATAQGIVKVFDGSWSKRERADLPKIIARKLNRGLPAFDLVRAAVGPAETNEALIEQAAVAFLSTLGSLVDQWIESGKGTDGSGAASPWARSIFWIGKGYPTPLANPLLEAIQDGIAKIQLSEEGRLIVAVHPLDYKHTDPLLKAQELGIYDFILLLAAPTRERLSKCDECKKYFVHARTPKKDALIFHGTFCGDCKGKGGARRTLGTRERRNKRLITLAAQFWPKWKSLPRYGKKSKWVANQVNERLRQGEQHVTGKWVTQNRVKIQTEIEGTKNATRNS